MPARGGDDEIDVHIPRVFGNPGYFLPVVADADQEGTIARMVALEGAIVHTTAPPKTRSTLIESDQGDQNPIEISEGEGDFVGRDRDPESTWFQGIAGFPAKEPQATVSHSGQGQGDPLGIGRFEERSELRLTFVGDVGGHA